LESSKIGKRKFEDVKMSEFEDLRKGKVPE